MNIDLRKPAAELIETTAGQVAAELKRRGIASDRRILVAIGPGNEDIGSNPEIEAWQVRQIREAFEEAKTAGPNKFLSNEELDERLSRYHPS